MGGVLTHLGIALVGGIIIKLLFREYGYAFAFALGQIMPDVIDFGIAGVKQWSWNPAVIINNPWFTPLARFSHSPLNWLIFAFIVILVMFILYKFKKIKKHVFARNSLLVAFLIIGVAVHLIVDILVIETSYWI